MHFALRDRDFEKEEMELVKEWLLAQTNWKLSLAMIINEEVKRQGLKDKLGLKEG